MKKNFLAITIALSVASTPCMVCADDFTAILPADTDITDIPGGEAAISNDDGTISITLSEDELLEWKSILDETVETGIKEMQEDDETYPCFDGIEYNEDMTEITLSIKDGYSLDEIMSLYMAIYNMAPIYQQACGISADKVEYTLTTVDSDAGEELSITTYTEMKADFETMVTVEDEDIEMDDMIVLE